ncbi:MAG: hypothetical protein CFE34_13355 [Rhodobacteraceae bacterium PARR1]|nr:MAG: hypothetical protein CFE34_13355 [Rhodobacteraceae bacterium PARR1]
MAQLHHRATAQRGGLDRRDAPAGDSHSWHLYAVRVSPDARVNRDGLVDALFAARIGCSVHYIPLHLQPYWRDRYALQATDFPHSQQAYEALVSLPIYSSMPDAAVQRVCDVLHATLG